MTAADENPPDDPSVLSSLPGTRPQRRSPKRAATPTAASTAPTSPPRSPRPSKPPAAKPPRAKPPRAKSTPPPATAAQGYESDPIEGSVNPPSGRELLASVGQAAAELAEIGLNLAKRLARAALDRVPRL
jgi:hypothetical protein